MRDRSKEFGEAYERYSDELFRHCSLRLSDRERALELTQEAFVRAWQYIQRGQEVRELRPFLYRTLRNLIIDEYRRHKNTSLEGMMTGIPKIRAAKSDGNAANPPVEKTTSGKSENIFFVVRTTPHAVKNISNTLRSEANRRIFPAGLFT
jgi:RNA polymerase sigma factor (sigma-70 family)